MPKQFEYSSKYFKKKDLCINFLPDKKDYFTETIRLGFPGETSKEKMAKNKFTLENSLADKTIARPQGIK